MVDHIFTAPFGAAIPPGMVEAWAKHRQRLARLEEQVGRAMATPPLPVDRRPAQRVLDAMTDNELDKALNGDHRG